jgi:heme A synthase
VGSFRLAGASWDLITHSSFGTATVACAALALVLSEVSRRADHPRPRRWFPVALLLVAVLVLVTGFFGGAVVFGLDHYTRPP